MTLQELLTVRVRKILNNYDGADVVNDELGFWRRAELKCVGKMARETDDVFQFHTILLLTRRHLCICHHDLGRRRAVGLKACLGTENTTRSCYRMLMTMNRTWE